MACQIEGAYRFCPPDLDNVVTYTIIGTEVSPKAPPTQRPLTELIPSAIQFGIPFVVTYFGYLQRAQQIETLLAKVAAVLKQHWLFIFVIAVLLISLLSRL